MRNKLGYLTIVLMLMGGLMGGCPTGVDNPLDPNDSAATDDSGQSTDDGTTDGSDSTDNSADDGSTDDGATDNGSTDDGSTDDGSTDDGITDSGSTDNGDDNDSGSTDTVLTGNFAGTVECTKTEAISGGALGLAKSWNENFAFEIDAAGIPVEYTIPGYMQSAGGIQFVAQVHQVGDTVTLTETSGTYTATLQVTVALASYNANGGSVTLQLAHNGVKGSLTEVGTGICNIEFTADGDNVTYASTTDYAVKLNGIVSTQWHVVCDGSLAPQ